MPFRKEWPRWDECPPSERNENTEAAIAHWSARVKKHSKTDGCSGCLNEAKNELSKWQEAKPEQIWVLVPTYNRPEEND
jgi:hypothetical protein